jgi:hypothetical protein
MLPIGRRFGCRNWKAPEEIKTAGWRKFMGPSFERSFCMEDVQINVDYVARKFTFEMFLKQH